MQQAEAPDERVGGVEDGGAALAPQREEGRDRALVRGAQVPGLLLHDERQAGDGQAGGAEIGGGHLAVARRRGRVEGVGAAQQRREARLEDGGRQHAGKDEGPGRRVLAGGFEQARADLVDPGAVPEDGSAAALELLGDRALDRVDVHRAAVAPGRAAHVGDGHRPPPHAREDARRRPAAAEGPEAGEQVEQVGRAPVPEEAQAPAGLEVAERRGGRDIRGQRLQLGEDAPGKLLVGQAAEEAHGLLEIRVAHDVVARQRVLEPARLDLDLDGGDEGLPALLQRQAPVVEAVEPGRGLARPHDDLRPLLLVAKDRAAGEIERLVDRLRRAARRGFVMKEYPRLGVPAPIADDPQGLGGERVVLRARHRLEQLHEGPVPRIGHAVLVPMLEAGKIEPPALAVARCADAHEVRLRPEDRDEADPELADLRQIVLLRALEEHEEVVVDDALVHPVAVVLDGDDGAAFGVVVNQRDVDAVGAGVDRVLDQLAIEAQRLGELVDELLDEVVDLERSGAVRLRGPGHGFGRDRARRAGPRAPAVSP